MSNLLTIFSDLKMVLVGSEVPKFHRFARHLLEGRLQRLVVSQSSSIDQADPNRKTGCKEESHSTSGEDFGRTN